jgi:DMSO/TMAO reductase YedYZ molybdopterin-dependent catalytic subunit
MSDLHKPRFPPSAAAQGVRPPDPISYARSLPREKAVQPEVLIAYQMNGRDLSRDHGYPVRAIVPGHYGMAAVKWLRPAARSEEPENAVE